MLTFLQNTCLHILQNVNTRLNKHFENAVTPPPLKLRVQRFAIRFAKWRLHVYACCSFGWSCLILFYLGGSWKILSEPCSLVIDLSTSSFWHILIYIYIYIDIYELIQYFFFLYTYMYIYIYIYVLTFCKIHVYIFFKTLTHVWTNIVKTPWHRHPFNWGFSVSRSVSPSGACMFMLAVPLAALVWSCFILADLGRFCQNLVREL